jgi:hypothetical protein
MGDADLRYGARPVEIANLVPAISQRHRPSPSVAGVAAGAVHRFHMMDDDIARLDIERDDIEVTRRAFDIRTAFFRRRGERRA